MIFMLLLNFLSQMAMPQRLKCILLVFSMDVQ